MAFFVVVVVGFFCNDGDSTSIWCEVLQTCTSSWKSRAVEGSITPCVLCFLLLKETRIKKQGNKRRMWRMLCLPELKAM